MIQIGLVMCGNVQERFSASLRCYTLRVTVLNCSVNVMHLVWTWLCIPNLLTVFPLQGVSVPSVAPATKLKFIKCIIPKRISYAFDSQNTCT